MKLNYNRFFNKSLNVILFLVLSQLVLSGCGKTPEKFDFNNVNNRVWIGEEFWAVPLEDWLIENDRIEFIGSYTNSRVNVLTGRLNGAGDLYLSFRFGILENGSAPGKTGVRLAMSDHTDNGYKSLCYHGKGIDIGVNTSGKLFINQEEVELPSGFVYSEMTMTIQAKSDENSKGLDVSISDVNGLSATISTLKIDDLEGMIALVNNFDQGMVKNSKGPKFWFDDLKISGTMLEATPQNALGLFCFQCTP